MPKRIVAVFAAALVLIGILIVTASPAQDSPASKPPAAALLAVDSAPDLHAQSLKVLDHQLSKAAWLDSVLRHQQYLADQEAARKAAAAKATQQAAQAQPASPGPSGASGGGVTTGGTLGSLIARYFAWGGSYAIGRATCIALRESGGDPGATNPNSGAAGYFQWMPGVWPAVSSEAGWGGASVYNGTANVAVAGYWAQHHGWSAWAGGSGGCGF